MTGDFKSKDLERVVGLELKEIRSPGKVYPSPIDKYAQSSKGKARPESTNIWMFEDPVKDKDRM